MNAPISALLESKGCEVHTVPVTATVFEAVQEMIANHIGSVMVVEGKQLVGIFTERDVLVRVVGGRRDPVTTPVTFVMTHDPISIDSAMTLQDVVELHGGRDFRHLPVVDDGRIVGMVSFRDVLRWLTRANGVDVDTPAETADRG